ncbi:hypothetical protein Pint_25717 [Pistacia integerrima]|uniref:Uncharacterized protein n=1 Tax=Pistacia integerrima TaxID=434235 RepID=A0ACC0YGU2_9ROSI|nr:hypothetical protein Pint_25717 [Pistacia integerrima]
MEEKEQGWDKNYRRLQKRREKLQKVRESLHSDRDKIFKKDFKQPSLWFTPLFCHNNIISTGEMKELENEVKGLCCQIENEGGVGYSFQTNIENYRAWERISDFCLKEEAGVVGVEQQTEELLARLIPKPDGDDGGQSAQVIGVVGEGGSGKTTLARSVYNRVDVKQHFTQRAWVHASSVLKSRDVFIDILNQIHPDGFFLEVTISDEEAMFKLTQLLEDIRHLIVIDDIEARQVSQSLQDALCSSSSHGGRIIITTRNKRNLPLEAAQSALLVRRLNPENGWKLFSKKVLSEAKDDSELIKLKEQILNLTGGLSLQVVLLGSLLSTKERSYDKWSKVIERATTNFGEDMLALSYQDLPPQVKPCFLYLMLFPRAFEIPVRRLIHQWCAEGFTTSFDSHDQDIVPEDVAEMYFEELVIRNLIQVTIWRLDGRPKSCRIPRVVYDAFCQKASDLGFVYNPLHSSHTSTQFVVRRLSLYLNVIKFPTPNHPHHFRYIRSYVAFDSQIRRTGTKGIASFLKSSISNRGFCLLKVLVLEGVYKPEIHSDVLEKLLRLRYIGLRSTFIEYLPSSVSQLLDLETLDLKHTHISDILYRVRRAEKLQHLYLNWIYQDRARWGVYLPLLKNLRTLWGLRLSDDLRKMDDLNKLTCLRKLGLKFDKSVNSSRLLKMAEHYKLNDLYLGEIEYDLMPILGELPDLNILKLLADSYKASRVGKLDSGGRSAASPYRNRGQKLQKIDIHSRVAKCYHFERNSINKHAIGISLAASP